MANGIAASARVLEALPTGRPNAPTRAMGEGRGFAALVDRMDGLAGRSVARSRDAHQVEPASTKPDGERAEGAQPEAVPHEGGVMERLAARQDDATEPSGSDDGLGAATDDARAAPDAGGVSPWWLGAGLPPGDTVWPELTEGPASLGGDACPGGIAEASAGSIAKSDGGPWPQSGLAQVSGQGTATLAAMQDEGLDGPAATGTAPGSSGRPAADAALVRTAPVAAPLSSSPNAHAAAAEVAARAGTSIEPARPAALSPNGATALTTGEGLATAAGPAREAAMGIVAQPALAAAPGSGVASRPNGSTDTSPRAGRSVDDRSSRRAERAGFPTLSAAEDALRKAVPGEAALDSPFKAVMPSAWASKRSWSASEGGPVDAQAAAGGYAPVSIGASHAVPAEASVARAIARQVAAHPALVAEGKAELRLTPEELGPLRLVVEGSDNGLRLVIEAAKPETADLLRRHVEALRQELRQEGLGSVGVSIGGGEAHRDGGAPTSWDRSGTAPRTMPPEAALGPAPTAVAAPAPRGRGASGHLDLRF